MKNRYRVVFFSYRDYPFVKEYTDIYEVSNDQMRMNFTGIQLISNLDTGREPFLDYVIDGEDVGSNYEDLLKQKTFDLDMKSFLDFEEEM